MTETVTYTVPAIHCAHCAQSIQEEVSEVEGVDEVDVDLETKLVTIHGSRLDDAALRAAIGRRATRLRDGDRDAEARVELALEGMTCAACATRIERKLNKLEGVEASVNYATEQAAVTYDADRVARRRSHRRGRGRRIPRTHVGRCQTTPRIVPGRCERGSQLQRR